MPQQQPPQPPQGGAGAQPQPDAQSGLQVAYFAFKVGGPQGKPVGLFRIADDPDAQVLTMERFSPSGEWTEDPTLIDELQEPGAYSVDEQEAQSIQQAVLGAHDPTQDASAAPPQA